MVSKLVIKSNQTLDTDTDTIIVTFSGYAITNSVQKFDFKNILNDNSFNNIDKHFYIDKHQYNYHKGIDGISNDIEETIIYLKNEIKDYKNIIFIGISSGGYAAILFGSLLNINTIIAFIPQTKLILNKNYNEKYRDLKNIINNISQYYIYGDLSIKNINNCHHISHCERINGNSNVNVIEYGNLNLRILKQTGELLNILKKIII